MLVSVSHQRSDALQQAAGHGEVPCQRLGVVTATPTLQVLAGQEPWLTADLAHLAHIDEQAIPRRIESRA